MRPKVTVTNTANEPLGARADECRVRKENAPNPGIASNWPVSRNKCVAQQLLHICSKRAKQDVALGFRSDSVSHMATFVGSNSCGQLLVRRLRELNHRIRIYKAR
eukprot:Amastigsp_a176958_48.p6 type:complete len:105 gc:universal Amastigsp_a176958_48:2704-2390(-)